MIKKLNSLKEFGIFRNFVETTELQEFKKYNLFYGWNGSGKSTFAKLFDCVNTKKIDADFQNCSFKILLNNGVQVDNKNVSKIETGLKLSVFNNRFVRENIDWDNITKRLLYISKEKVEEKKKLLELKEEHRTLEISKNIIENKVFKIQNDCDNFLTVGAKEVKTQFEVLSTDDNYYLNYDKRKLKRIIDNNENQIKKVKLIAKSKEINGLKMTARLEELDKVNYDESKQLQIEQIKKLEDEINSILKKSIAFAGITSLKNNPKVGSWVEEGIEIHRNSKKCKFCKNTIEQTRIDELNAHFNTDFKLLKEEVKVLITKVEEYQDKISNSLPGDFELFQFLKSDYNKQISNLQRLIKELIKSFSKVNGLLGEKLDNPFLTNFQEVSIDNKLVEGFNSVLNSITKIIQAHNTTSDDFENYVKSAKKKLEMSIAQSEVKKFKYFSKLREKKSEEKKIIPLEKKISLLEKKIEILDASLSDEILGAEEFNNKLHRFLNHSDLSIKYNESKKGYEIIRKIGRKKERGNNLSEGEKTAISFIYFLTKLLENEDELKETIVIIDDPISSFDSNHLFNSYSFIKNICNDTKQLFVLTHNFTFYRLVRDWMLGKKKWRTKTDGSKYVEKKYAVFNITSSYSGNLRESIIQNADNALLDYSTEYHYLFLRLKGFISKPKLSIEECFSVANMSRKLLEIFLNFKFPRKRNDFAQLFNHALPNKSDLIMREKVYRFINKYSHSDHIEAFDNSIDNILSESDNIAKDVLKIIKKLDKKHYEELIEIGNE
ncbi:AAA family ATPase [Flavobacterium sp. ASW18X]|uniref:AAA family ATPase n=1 Tax=Flavobacterium sp. ASW18X TaxID=2572595 RepID=UPI0010AE824A|nr:AAA family ATPase [Flavobacterium sp. ASW18X]TKD66050.1 outer membrane beta-barrel protein [Flavobacterium sp. ASW18X]